MAASFSTDAKVTGKSFARGRTLRPERLRRDERYRIDRSENAVACRNIPLVRSHHLLLSFRCPVTYHRCSDPGPRLLAVGGEYVCARSCEMPNRNIPPLPFSSERIIGKPHLIPLSSNRTRPNPAARHPTPPAWMALCTPFYDRRRWQHSVALDGKITCTWWRITLHWLLASMPLCLETIKAF
jgi:hypothetical protein